jgi:hypothetical protein
VNAPNLDYETQARAVLRTMTTEQLQRSLGAFPRPASGRRPSILACFLGYAFRDGDGISREDFSRGYSRGRFFKDGWILEAIYEHNLPRFAPGPQSDWLYGEVLRELAERGVTPEVPLRAPVEVA